MKSIVSVILLLSSVTSAVAGSDPQFRFGTPAPDQLSLVGPLVVRLMLPSPVLSDPTVQLDGVAVQGLARNGDVLAARSPRCRRGRISCAPRSWSTAAVPRR